MKSRGGFTRYHAMLLVVTGVAILAWLPEMVTTRVLAVLVRTEVWYWIVKMILLIVSLTIGIILGMSAIVHQIRDFDEVHDEMFRKIVTAEVVSGAVFLVMVVLAGVKVLLKQGMSMSLVYCMLSWGIGVVLSTTVGVLLVMSDALWSIAFMWFEK